MLNKPATPAALEWARPDPTATAQPLAPTGPSVWATGPDALPAPAPEPLDPDHCPPDAAERIRAVASRGGSLKGLPALFGVAPDVFKRWMDEDPSLRKAFDEGKEQEREALHRTIYELAIFRKDLTAAQFLLKTRHGYREQEPEDARNSVRIIFNLPAAAPDLKTYVEQATLLGVAAKPRKPAILEHE